MTKLALNHKKLGICSLLFNSDNDRNEEDETVQFSVWCIVNLSFD